MKLQKEFREEYFAKIKADGYELNGQMFIEMEKELYIEWLEAKLQNTTSNRDYTKCRKEIVKLFEECDDIPDPFYIEQILRKHFV